MSIRKLTERNSKNFNRNWIFIALFLPAPLKIEMAPWVLLGTLASLDLCRTTSIIAAFLKKINRVIFSQNFAAHLIIFSNAKLIIIILDFNFNYFQKVFQKSSFFQSTPKTPACFRWLGFGVTNKRDQNWITPNVHKVYNAINTNLPRVIEGRDSSL